MISTNLKNINDIKANSNLINLGSSGLVKGSTASVPWNSE
jgi:hypothetical protein